MNYPHSIRKFFFVAAISLASAIASADDAPSKINAPASRETAQQTADKVKRPLTGNHVLIVNTTDVVKDETIAKFSDFAKSLLKTEIKTERKSAEGCLLKLASGITTNPSTPFAIIICADDNMPTLLAAPENRWAIINIRSLLVDGNLDGEVAKHRFTKELWRAFGYACGADNSIFPGCVLKPINNVSDLDAMKAKTLGPQTINVLLQNFAKHGIYQDRFFPYALAVRQGWAPAPTNEFQKAIWEKVKAAKEAAAKPAEATETK